MPGPSSSSPSHAEEQLRDARAAAEQARGRLELLARAGVVFSGSLEPQATLEEIAGPHSRGGRQHRRR